MPRERGDGVRREDDDDEARDRCKDAANSERSILPSLFVSNVSNAGLVKDWVKLSKKLLCRDN